MKTVFKFTLLALLIALFASPALAQESTESPSPTAETLVTEAPVVVVEAPENVGTTYNIEPLFATLGAVVVLVLLLFNAVQSFWIYKSVPREVADQILTRAELLAKITSSAEDDKIVAAMREAYNKLTKAEIDSRS